MTIIYHFIFEFRVNLVSACMTTIFPTFLFWRPFRAPPCALVESSHMYHQPVPRRYVADAQDFGNHSIRTLKLLFTRHRGAHIPESLVLK
ncbi:hypothetical protein Peur_069623 [Populus x canadensis]